MSFAMVGHKRDKNLESLEKHLPSYSEQIKESYAKSHTLNSRKQPSNNKLIMHPETAYTTPQTAEPPPAPTFAAETAHTAPAAMHPHA